MASEATSTEPQEYHVSVGPWSLRVLEHGAGTPIVLVHGLGTSASTWRRNIAALSCCGRVLAVDLPGFGGSDDPQGFHCASQMAIVLKAWCDAMGLTRAHFIGHSLGGEICLWLAAQHPELVDKLILAGSTGAPVRPNQLVKLLRLLSDGIREPLSFMPVLLRAYMRAGPRRIYRTARASDPRQLAPHLAAIQAETYVVWGANDPVIPLAEARTLERMLPNGRLVIVSDAAHGLIFDAPETFNRAVCGLLSRSKKPAETPRGLPAGI